MSISEKRLPIPVDRSRVRGRGTQILPRFAEVVRIGYGDAKVGVGSSTGVFGVVPERAKNAA